MKYSGFNEEMYHEAFIKTAQYIVRLTAEQDVYEHLNDMMINFFKVAWAAFAEKDKMGQLFLHHCTIHDPAIQEKILTENTRETISDVLSSGFVAMEIIPMPAPKMTVFLPITERNQTKCLMLVAHNSTEKLPNNLLNIYLAMVGIAGTTIERLSSELELRKHRDHLEEIVRIRTAELVLKNSQLEEEIIERNHAEQLLKNTHDELEETQGELLHVNETLEKRVAQEVLKNMEQKRMLIHQSRMAAMGEMIDNIAHQWRQPLNTLSILLFNFKDAYQYNEMDETFLEKNVADGNRLIQKMSSTINDFRNFFHPDKEKKVFSAMGQISEAVALVEASFKHNGISIHIDVPDDLMLSGFPNEYSQVLLNLLSNAKDAILKHRPLISGKVNIVLARQCDQGCISVIDNGGGIPQNILGRIFDPYFSTKEKGSGIGLYMSKMIIEDHMKGSITATNIEGGTEFRISVPLADNAQQNDLLL